jgi:alkylation response protein AidB-like acyl-CoA dehydrogenase
MDMRSPGITVRQIRPASGPSEFCELFLDNVEIPVANRVGPENGGWQVAQSTLAAERGMTIVELSLRLRGAFDGLVALARAAGVAGDAGVRRELAQLNADIEALRQLVGRMLDKVIAGEAAAEDPSYIKIHYSELLHRFTECGVRLAGLRSQCERPFLMGGGYETGNWMFDFLNAWMWTIAGGSNEIIRTVIAERILGLPR